MNEIKFWETHTRDSFRRVLNKIVDDFIKMGFAYNATDLDNEKINYVKDCLFYLSLFLSPSCIEYILAGFRGNLDKLIASFKIITPFSIPYYYDYSSRRVKGKHIRYKPNPEQGDIDFYLYQVARHFYFILKSIDYKIIMPIGDGKTYTSPKAEIEKILKKLSPLEGLTVIYDYNYYFDYTIALNPTDVVENLYDHYLR